MLPSREKKGGSRNSLVRRAGCEEECSALGKPRLKKAFCRGKSYVWCDLKEGENGGHRDCLQSSQQRSPSEGSKPKKTGRARKEVSKEEMKRRLDVD